MELLIDTHEFTAQCPNCGKRVVPDTVTRRFSDAVITFFNCPEEECDFSSWDATDFNWGVSK